VGINVATLYKWINQYSEIGNALKKGKRPVDMEVENALLKRALGYDWEEETTEIYSDGRKHVKKIKRHVPPDPTAMIFWLKNRKPKQWRDRPTTDEDSDALKAAKLLLEGVNSAIN
jgi:hypothetical protein